MDSVHSIKMARELIISSHKTFLVPLRSPFLGFFRPKSKNPTISNSLFFQPNRFFCKCSHGPVDIVTYKETFSRRMNMAGLKPHHRIAMGVSGGPDSIALCVLAAGWKIDAHVGIDETNGYINGLLAVVVDHGLRVESNDEANCVRNRVSKMGIRCEVAQCSWPDGKPKQGHLQEMARDMRYQILQKVCVENQMGVLLIAHHADDQAELFVLRLSRNSGVLGLAGMAFTSELFPTHLETSSNHGILLARPLMEFSKEDMYKICKGGKQEWVEDPTNQSQLFARNRIRMSLTSSSSCIISSELQAIISACRRTRSFVDKVCSNLINQAVTVAVHGYAILDLEKLDPLNVDDICLSKFIALVLQFISQRHRPVRGRTSRLLLDYIRNLPCKSSLTAAGCYLCAAPQSKGTKILVCYSPHSRLSIEMELFRMYPCERKKHFTPSEMEQILMDGKSYTDRLVPDASDVPFLHATSSESILSEGKRLGILSESTHKSILLLQKEETGYFSPKTELTSSNEARHAGRSVNASQSEPFQAGQFYHFTNRFLVSWRLDRKVTNGIPPSEETGFHSNSKGQSKDFLCKSCVVEHDTIPQVRLMIDTDWLYVAQLSKGHILEESQKNSISCSEYVKLSAQRALHSLKSIPLAARRGLPVLVSSQGQLLSIPSICFNHCPCLSVSADFKPRVPLGGGHCSFI